MRRSFVGNDVEQLLSTEVSGQRVSSSRASVNDERSRSNTTIRPLEEMLSLLARVGMPVRCVNGVPGVVAPPQPGCSMCRADAGVQFWVLTNVLPATNVGRYLSPDSQRQYGVMFVLRNVATPAGVRVCEPLGTSQIHTSHVSVMWSCPAAGLL